MTTAPRAYPEAQFMPQPWMDQAACRDRDPELWFTNVSTSADQVREAKSVCEGCVVAAQCLTYAVEYPAPLFGIWGGTTEAQRDEMRKRRGTSRTGPQPRRMSAMTEEMLRLRSFGWTNEQIADRLGTSIENIQAIDRRSRAVS